MNRTSSMPILWNGYAHSELVLETSTHCNFSMKYRRNWWHLRSIFQSSTLHIYTLQIFYRFLMWCEQKSSIQMLNFKLMTKKTFCLALRSSWPNSSTLVLLPLLRPSQFGTLYYQGHTTFAHYYTELQINIITPLSHVKYTTSMIAPLL